MTFDFAFNLLPPQGWLFESEARLLWDTVARTHGSILEVGCYYGRSTCLLACSGRPLYCVDPFSNFDSDDFSGNKVEAAWRANLAKFAAATGIDISGVSLFRQRVEDWTPQPAGFGYLDGDHTGPGTAAQIQAALACGVEVIGIHDVNDDGVGVCIRDAAVELLGPWQVRVERLAVWEVKEWSREAAK